MSELFTFPNLIALVGVYALLILFDVMRAKSRGRRPDRW